MKQDPTIASVSVEGLHDQFDFHINLLPGLNVLYGKNGRGKTTLLHLLANILELDFQRFTFLQFHRITVATSLGDSIDLIKDEPGTLPKVFLNGNLTSLSSTNSLSELELERLREALGERPTYLPAFRSILERARSDQERYYRNAAAERRDADYELVAASELTALRAHYGRQGVGITPRQIQDEAVAIAEKTILCRQWFGKFVPVIRYPSVADVEDALSEEWRRAALEVSSKEQRMFEETFVQVFRIVSGLESIPTTETNDDIISSISSLLMDQEIQASNSESRAVFDKLLMSAHSLSSSNTPMRGVDNSLLGLYRQLLETRNSERRVAFQKSREFEQSINRFLDNKTLKIGNTGSRPRLRQQVLVNTSAGPAYGLSALSSGERQILTMLYSASRTRFASGAFLIDEPELSLHIDWQRIILKELRNQSPDRQIIACTHSPEVGADHFLENQDFEPEHSPRGQDTLFTDEEL
ncbi:AAA family ATPase [Hydrogenophaga palleronii]|uniref:AAA family ATPase n=1 Tax=Hydrogenophaga palleronii TaxID=65655 RepID=UPI000A0668C9|nr:AAA family ATPase [Hydrogenophaga palleronii]